MNVDDTASLLDNPPAGSPTYDSAVPTREQPSFENNNNNNSANNPKQVPPRFSRSTILGIFCLVLCLITWETMGELLQDVNIQYPKPAMLTYVVHSWYTTLLIPLVIYRRDNLKAVVNKHWMMIKLAVGLFPLMWLAAYLWYVSLRQTLVSANNAIYQSQCVFVYLCSLVILGEKFDLKKVGVLALCVAGVVLVVFTGTSEPGSVTNATLLTAPSSSSSSSSSSGPEKIVIHQTLWGYAALLLGVIAFAIYEVLFKAYEQREEKRKRKERRAAGRLGAAGMTSTENEGEDNLEASVVFLGTCGVVNIVLAWPFIPLFSAIGLEPFEWATPALTRSIMLNGFIDTIFNFAFIWGVALTSPVFMSTGTILIIPLGIAVDGLLGKGSMNFAQLCGVGLIVCGFLGLNIVERLNHRKKKRSCGSSNDKMAGNGNNGAENGSFSGAAVVVTNAEDAW